METKLILRVTRHAGFTETFASPMELKELGMSCSW